MPFHFELKAGAAGAREKYPNSNKHQSRLLTFLPLDVEEAGVNFPHCWHRENDIELDVREKEREMEKREQEFNQHWPPGSRKKWVWLGCHSAAVEGIIIDLSGKQKKGHYGMMLSSLSLFFPPTLLWLLLMITSTPTVKRLRGIKRTFFLLSLHPPTLYVPTTRDHQVYLKLQRAKLWRKLELSD